MKSNSTVSKVIFLLVMFFISALFVAMIRDFLMAILLAGIFSSMAQPLYKRIVRLFRGRRNLGAAATLALILLVILLPLMGLLGIVTGQAIRISRTVKPWVEQKIQEPSSLDELINKLPHHDTILKYREEIFTKAGEFVSSISGLLFNSASSITLSTFNYVFLFFVFLYTMFFFLREGDLILNKILYYLPLTDSDERRLLERFTSVTRATIKGTLVIGAIQGGLAGLAFWVVGIPSALFWATVMTFLSIIPAVGSAIIWFPAAVILAASGHWIKGLGLLIFCGGLVGSVDNVLRPRLVGRDTRMHELLIFFGTMGGLSLFGLVGFIIGPIIAALFATVWDIYGVTFKDYLPEVKSAKQEGRESEKPSKPEPVEKKKRPE